MREVMVSLGGSRKARMLDISPDGARLELATALSPNSSCRLSLLLPDGMTCVRCRVVRCRLTALSGSEPTGNLVYSAAVEFVDVLPEVTTAILFAYPPPAVVKNAPGPIKARVKVGTLEPSPSGGAHRAR
jgi:hypothetical protein